MATQVTWAKVREEIHAARANRTVLAHHMGYLRSPFSTLINSRDSIGPTSEWYERFKAALAEMLAVTE